MSNGDVSKAEMNSDVVMRASGVCKTYPSPAGELEVLRGVDLEIGEGEIVAITGRSGVGKSTFLNILGLLDRPSKGELSFFDRGKQVDVSRLSKSARAGLRNRQLGFIFQFYHLLPDLSVLENVLLPSMISNGRLAYRRRRGELLEQARGLLSRVGVEREKQRPNTLSGGERQRVAVARALMNQPRLVLCDEPTGNLDTGTSDQIHQLFVDLNRELKTSFLLVTHDPSLAGKAQRQLHMVDGRFVDAA